MKILSVQETFKTTAVFWMIKFEEERMLAKFEKASGP